MRLSLWGVCFLFFSFGGSVRAADGSLGDGLGVGLEILRSSESDFEAVKRAGFTAVRVGLTWPEIEHSRATFGRRYDWHRYDRLMDKLEELGFRVVLTLGKSNPLYAERVPAPQNNFGMEWAYAAPATDDYRAAFVDFAVAAVKRYGGNKKIIWTIWNEPDMGIFWPPKPDVMAYAALAEAACLAMKAERKESFVVAPDLAFSPRFKGDVKREGFLKALMASPAGACLDGVSVHPYRDGAVVPETVAQTYDALRALVPSDKVLLSTEWGYTTVWARAEQQAAYLVRAHLANRKAGVPISIWYEWKSQGFNPENPEDQFGLFDGEGKAKEFTPQLLAFLPQLQELFLVRDVSLEGDDVRALLVRNKKGKLFLLFWLAKSEGRETRLMSDGQKISISIMPSLLSVSDSSIHILKD